MRAGRSLVEATLVMAVVVTPLLLVPSRTAASWAVTTTAAQDPRAAEAALSLDRPARRVIQHGLRNEGFDPGAPDGLFGPRTRGAIRRWQEVRGEPATGYLDAVQAGLLRTAGAPRQSSPVEAAPPTVLTGESSTASAQTVTAAPQQSETETSASLGPPNAEPATGADRMANCDEWNTPEYFATATAEDVTACLAAGADIAARDGGGTTPLHWAALRTEAPAVIQTLLGAGANLTARNGNGFTPAHLAAQQNSNPAVLQLLVAAEADLGANLNSRPVQNTSPAQARGSAPLPPAILLDSYLLRAEQSVRDNDQRGALEAMEQLVALYEEHELVVVAEYHYRYARVWNAVGAWDQPFQGARHKN